jgi:hypothetical protein
MVLLAILVASSSYSQYPIIKKIGDDSLILMTLKQGNDINKSFIQTQKKLDSLKDSVSYKRLLIDCLITKRYQLRSSLSSRSPISS